MAEKNIKFISEKHKAFYMEKMQNAKFKDVYHQALYYCLGVNADTRFHFENILMRKFIASDWNACRRAGRQVAA